MYSFLIVVTTCETANSGRGARELIAKVGAS